MPNNCSGSNQDTPMPRGFSGGAEPLKVVRILDGNACYPDSYTDGNGEDYYSTYNAHEPDRPDTDDDMIGPY